MSALSIALSWLPSWAASLGGLGLFLAAAVAGVYSMLPVAPYRQVAVLTVFGLSVAAGWTAGFSAADARCEANEVRAQLTAAQARIVTLQSQALALQRDSVMAASQSVELKALREKANAQNIPDGACLDGDSARRLRELWPAPAKR